MGYINKERLVQCFVELAKIKSPSGHEEEICCYLAEIMDGLGLKVVKDNYGNLVAKLSGRGEDNPIILCAHMDTVGVGVGEEIQPQRKGNIITSDGSTILGADNKDAISAIIEAMMVINERALPHRAAEIVFTREEEAISRGAKNLDYSLLIGKDCIIADSEESFGTIIYGAPFCDRFNVKIIGKRAHAKDPRKGVDVTKIIGRSFMTMPLGYIDEFTSSNIAFQASGLSGSSIDREIDSGTLPELFSKEGRNTVPDVAYVFGEVRGLKGALVKSNLEAIKLAFEAACVEYGGELLFESVHLADGYFYGKNDSLFEKIDQVFQEQGTGVRYVTSKGGSDANIFFQNGIKPAVIGSAHRNPHKNEEYLVIDDLVKLADFYVRYLTNPI